MNVAERIDNAANAYDRKRRLMHGHGSDLTGAEMRDARTKMFLMRRQ